MGPGEFRQAWSRPGGSTPGGAADGCAVLTWLDSDIGTSPRFLGINQEILANSNSIVIV